MRGQRQSFLFLLVDLFVLYCLSLFVCCVSVIILLFFLFQAADDDVAGDPAGLHVPEEAEASRAGDQSPEEAFGEFVAEWFM